MTRTGSPFKAHGVRRTARGALLVAATVVVVMLSAPARAQTPAPPATPPAATRPVERGDLRHQIYVMEGALMRAVSFGAQRLTREIRAIVPEMMTVSGEPQARGIYLEGYGVFFDVGVPVLHQSMVWSLQTMLRQDDKGTLEAIKVLKEFAKDARTPANRAAIDNAIARLEVQLGPLKGSSPFPELRFQQNPPEQTAATMVSSDPGAAGSPVPQPAPTVQPAPPPDLKYLQDPKLLQDPNGINRAYTTSVQNALTDAMLDYGQPMALGAEEFLTVGARDNMPRDSLAPPDPYEEVVTVVLRIRGSDLAAYRAGQIDREAARKRVQVKEF